MTTFRFSSFAIAGALIFTYSAHAGDQPHKGRYVNLTPSELHCTKLDDVEGHNICTYEIPGVGILEDGTVNSRVAKGTLDYINGEGLAEGYTVVTYPDGSTMTHKWSGNSKINDQSVRVVQGTYECVAGTGAFAGVKCEGTWDQALQKGGFFVGEYEGKMTLPD